MEKFRPLLCFWGLAWFLAWVVCWFCEKASGFSEVLVSRTSWCYTLVVMTTLGSVYRFGDGAWKSWERLWNAGYGFRMVPNSWELVSTNA